MKTITSLILVAVFRSIGILYNKSSFDGHDSDCTERHNAQRS